MRIVIDLQGAQTESRFRGIGRYTLSLAQAIARNRDSHEIIIALNGLLQETIEPIRLAFDGLLPRENIRVWYAPGPVRESASENNGYREIAEHMREAFLASLQPDIVHISSLFEGYLDDAITSIGVFNQSTPTVVTLYDLIPLINAKEYLNSNPLYERYYLRKIDHLKKATGWLSISMFSKREALAALRLREDLIFNVSTACDSHFRKVFISEEKAINLRQEFGLTRNFLVCVGASDGRKNLPRLVRAYGLLHPELRQAHQLLLVGKVPEGDIQLLQHVAKAAGLKKDDLVFGGYISDEQLVCLMNLCKLFVFPSWHEGFGLPVLEAMACGVPVIAANTSSLPEVIGREDTLFNPFSDEDIANKITMVLRSKVLQQELSQHGLKQSQLFDWDESARRAIKAFEQLGNKKYVTKSKLIASRKPKLAYVSPLPPERTGIADYSAELLPALSSYYDIEVITDQQQISHPWIIKNCKIHSAEWLARNASEYQRILYHVGNSPFHQYMFSLLKEIPGVVCLHDFFISNYSYYMEVTKKIDFYWCQGLYRSHGYKAVHARFHRSNENEVIYEYPCNFDILQSAIGIVVHSDYSKKLALQWYGSAWGKSWDTIPLVRNSCNIADQKKHRFKLGFTKGSFLVCSFGFLDHTKLNHRLLAAWLASDLAKDTNCYLIFVGENHGGDYGKALINTIKNADLEDRIRITGWVNNEVFRQYLSSSDLAVQLRGLSRGETSAAVLDCMNYALPTIINSNGSLADLSKDAVWMLDEKFEDESLVNALEILWRDEEKRKLLGSNAREIIIKHHAPEICAQRYVEAIERFYENAAVDRRELAKAIVSQNNLPTDEQVWRNLASCIIYNQPSQDSARRIFVDITATCHTSLKTGIERVTRSLLFELIKNPPLGSRVEPIYLSNKDGLWYYYYARQYTLEFLDCPTGWLMDEPVEFRAGDMLFAPDMAGSRLIEGEKSGLYHQLQDQGIRLFFMVHDLLPIILPDKFPPGTKDHFELWLACLCRIADSVICVTNTVADDLKNWLKIHPAVRTLPLHINWSHHGADLQVSGLIKGFSEVDTIPIRQITARISFLMVGTVEPRKGHLQTLAAFEILWAQGIDINLVIVGQEGWRDLPDSQRRTIPEIVSRLSYHPEIDKRLFWLKGVSDEYLKKIYQSSSCLIAASEGEGFGLPLIEAAQHGLPIIARDISAFREVAGTHAHYFIGLEPSNLASEIQDWLILYKQRKHLKSDFMPWLTWTQSAENLKKVFSEFSGDPKQNGW